MADIKTFRQEWLCRISESRGFGFVCHWLGWTSIQLGFHLDLRMKNIEIHLPFCYIRIGYESKFDYCVSN